ncbi:Probable RNA-directed DNA polymerase from transposon BS [Eumeta japonica]|uniref:Probable RNA-directed DNA polymerase from transposon BS n=1 Tax=Eumeta variegata TaxID=151549 RepID=A0A4C1U5V6_EUMVA|nr:Probable RNA-directed DNA polymerase from transposon BS [Eumeta japonica]
MNSSAFAQFLSTASPPLSRSRSSSGSTLSPLLYSAYTNDVPRPSSSGVQLALFADDTALFTEIGIGAPDSPSSPQRAIDELGQWFRKWRIEVNPTNQQPYNSSMDGDDIRVSVFAHAAPKHYIDYRTHRSDSSTSRDHIPMRSYARRLTINRRIPTLSVGHETYLPIHLTLLQRQLKAMTSTTRMTDLGGLSVSQVIDLSSLLHPPLTASGRQEKGTDP